jgi:hypothetical protein
MANPVPAPPPITPSSTSIACTFCRTLNPVGTAFCSSCGADLTQAAASSASAVPAPVPAIGIWGPRSSGKTMYLYALYRHILGLPMKNWEMSPENGDALNLLKTAERDIAEHRFPPPTPRSVPVTYLFKFTKREPRGLDREFMMEVMDWPGEIYEEPKEHYDELMKYLKRCTGLLCLIDPDQPSDDKFTAFLGNLLYDLQFANRDQQKRILQKMAFCLSKIDERQHQHKRYAPNNAIHEILGDFLIERVRDACAPGMVSFDFACSAVGMHPGHNSPRSNAGIDFAGKAIIYDVKNMKPIGLFDPLEKWLFA